MLNMEERLGIQPPDGTGGCLVSTGKSIYKLASVEHENFYQ